MDNENIIDSGSYNNNQLTVSRASAGYLNETGKWGKFLAIVGFCLLGLLVLMGLFAGTIFSTMGAALPFPGFIMGLGYVLLALLYFFPVYYLYKFSVQVRTALTTKDSQALDSAFENLKSHYKFIGILMIITLSFYVLIAGGAFLAGAMI